MSCKVVLESQGMEVESAVRLDDISGQGSIFHGVDEADELYEVNVNSSLTQNVLLEVFKIKAKPLFRQEWRRIAVDGKVESSDVLYVYIARKVE